MVKRKSGVTKGEMTGKELLCMMVSSGLCKSFQNNVHISHRKHIGCLNCIFSDYVNVYLHTHTHTHVHSLNQCVFLLQQVFLWTSKLEHKKHLQEKAQLKVSSVFLACVIQSSSLYFLTGTFMGWRLIISM
jgi:hypothetical protein